MKLLIIPGWYDNIVVHIIIELCIKRQYVFFCMVDWVNLFHTQLTAICGQNEVASYVKLTVIDWMGGKNMSTEGSIVVNCAINNYFGKEEYKMYICLSGFCSKNKNWCGTESYVHKD